MGKNILLLLFSLAISLLLIACGSDETGNNPVEDASVDTDESENDDGEETDTNNEQNKTQKSLSLPDGFPAHFPLPENIIITDVEDESEGNKKKYSIRFDFDPDIDLDAIFEMYNDYAGKLEYDVIADGEEGSTDGIYQYAAHDPKSADNRFIVTLRPEGGTYGSIDLRTMEE